MRKLIICKVCGKLKPQHAKGICTQCYKKQWAKDNPEKMKDYQKKRKQREYSEDFTQEHTPSHKKCPHCQRTLPANMFWREARYPFLSSWCKECHRKRNPTKRLQKQELTKRRNKQGLCAQCGQEPKLKQHTLGYTCWFKAVSSRFLNAESRWKELEEIAKKQKWRCAYTGQQLIPGKNMSLDHKIPKVVRPDLKDDIKNLQWTIKGVNKIKAGVQHEGFIEICRDIILEYYPELLCQ